MRHLQVGVDTRGYIQNFRTDHVCTAKQAILKRLDESFHLVSMIIVNVLELCFIQASLNTVVAPNRQAKHHGWLYKTSLD